MYAVKALRLSFSTVKSSYGAVLKETLCKFDTQDLYKCLSCHNIHTSHAFGKKRRTEEEKLSQRTNRRIIKVKTKNEVVNIWHDMTISDIAKVLNKDVDHVYESMEYIKDSENYTEDNSVIDNPKVIQNIVKLSGYRYRIIPKPTDRYEDENETYKDVVRSPPAPPENLKLRPPVVTIMGHVDHGKTTLLDALRNSNIVDQEFGGITQHIGAFSVQLPGKEIVTFLDTPGHAAFTSMRARGANITDIVVLVVAADDGVMEQTVESIRMAKEANVPMIVAINKMDKPGADPEATKRALADRAVLVEELGGDVQAVPISALKKTNLDLLIEAILLQSQMMDLKADPSGVVEGVVVEAQTDPKRGKIATVIVQRGTMVKGCVAVAGLGWVRVRSMVTSDGTVIEKASPSTPVRVFGWKELPSAGDELIEVPSERRAHQVIRYRHRLQMEEKQSSDMEVISAKEAEHKAVYRERLRKKRLMGRYRLKPEGPRSKLLVDSDEPTLSIVVKGDVDGSVEAIMDVLNTYNAHHQCKLEIVHYGVGDVSETDVELAECFDGMVYAFNVSYSPEILSLSKKSNVPLKKFNVIYRMIDDIKEELNVRIPTTQEEELLGEANVLENFSIDEKKKKANVAGCRCTRGTLKRDGLYKVIRNTEVVHRDELDSMRRHKDEVPAVKKDYECGLKMKDSGFEFKPGDTIVCYRLVEVKHATEWNPGF